jgi:hypothetical protein
VDEVFDVVHVNLRHILDNMPPCVGQQLRRGLGLQSFAQEVVESIRARRASRRLSCNVVIITEQFAFRDKRIVSCIELFVLGCKAFVLGNEEVVSS